MDYVGKVIKIIINSQALHVPYFQYAMRFFQNIFLAQLFISHPPTHKILHIKSYELIPKTYQTQKVSAKINKTQYWHLGFVPWTN
jgi:hypothetical protein